MTALNTARVTDNLAELGLDIPPPAAPAANYVPAVLSGNMVFVSGQLPMKGGEKLFIGKVGENISIEEAQKAAELCALNILAQLKEILGGDLSRVKRCVRVGGFVNCTPDFTEQPQVINGASNLIGKALGEAGRHARAAVGVNALPFGVAVEVEATFEVSA